MTGPLLSVDDLHVQFRTEDSELEAVDGASFSVGPGETVCLVGESGAGKTVTCESMTGLVGGPETRVDGTITFDGVDLTKLSEAELRDYRGERIAHVFQNPQNALDPVYTIGEQLTETIRFHRDVDDRQARERAVELLDRVGLPNAPSRLDEYPHEFSGGMKQRVVIAMALANDPDLLIADEPTTALDVTIEAQILSLLSDLQEERDMAILLVTHDLGVVAEVADEVVVMYAGKVMEIGGVYDVFEQPAHPYTQALLECLPERGRQPAPIGGEIPDATDPPSGCRFHPRCTHAIEECTGGDQPPLHEVSDGDQRAACLFYDGDHDPTVVQGDASAGDGQPGVTDGGTNRDGDRNLGVAEEATVDERSPDDPGAASNGKGGERR